MYFWGAEVGDFSKYREHKKLGRVCSCDVKSGTRIDNKLVFYTTESVEICFNRIFCGFYGTLNFNRKSVFKLYWFKWQPSRIRKQFCRELNDGCWRWHGRMTTDVSWNSRLDGQSEEKFYGFASMDVLLLKYYELQIRILTSGRSDIEKINRKKCKIHSDENR